MKRFHWTVVLACMCGLALPGQTTGGRSISPPSAAPQLWKKLPPEWAAGASVRLNDDEIVFFSGLQFLVYSIATDEAAGGGLVITWPGWPQFWERIDAAFRADADRIVLISGTQWVAYSIGAARIAEAPRPITEWSGWPWPSAPSAVLTLTDSTHVFFKKNRFTRCTGSPGLAGALRCEPEQGLEAWRGWPASWTEVSGAVNTGKDSAFLFHRGQALPFAAAAGTFGEPYATGAGVPRTPSALPVSASFIVPPVFAAAHGPGGQNARFTQAELKAHASIPRMRWIEVEGRSRRSLSDAGYLVMKDGKRLEGKISIRAKWLKTEKRWGFTEVELTNPATKAKQKITGATIADFGLQFTPNDMTKGGTKVSKEPAYNFQPGVVRMVDGSERDGIVALNKRFGEGVPSGAGARVYYAKDMASNVEELSPEAVQGVLQVRDGATYEFVSYQRRLMPLLVRIPSLLVFRNPWPSTPNDSFAANMRVMAGDYAKKKATSYATKSIAGGSFKVRSQSGQGLEKSITGAVGDAEKGGEAVGAVLDGIDLRGFKPEYVVVNLATGSLVSVTENNFLQELGPLMEDCLPVAQAAGEERNRNMDFRNFEALAAALGACYQPRTTK